MEREDIERAAKQSPWVSVKERLPKEIRWFFAGWYQMGQ